MRILNKIIIVIIFIAIIFVVIKDDYKVLYSKVVTYLKAGIDKTSIIYKDKIGEVSDIINNNNIDQVDKKSQIETPGALLVSDNFLTNNIRNISLSKERVIIITNKARYDNGNLSALTTNTKLNFSAEKKLQDMFVKGYFEHISPDGVGVGDLGNQAGYEYIIIGENLALGNFKDDQALVDAWMASVGHRENILNKRYTEIGVSVGKGVYNGKNVWMGVQHFGLPKSACPAIDGVLKGIIAIDEREVKSMESDLSVRRQKIESGVVYEGSTTAAQIEKYNSLVIEYNKFVINLKEKISVYNKQVHAFNDCISGATQ